MLKFIPVSIVSILLLGILAALHQYYYFPWYVFFIPFVVWITLTVIGSFHIRWNYHLISLSKAKNAKPNTVSITFDDGPHPKYTPKALALLKQFDAKATFFCIGKEIAAHPNITAQIVKEGHTIGNHTYSHSHQFGFFSAEQVQEELAQTQEILAQSTGKKGLLYRPAFGVTNPNIKKAIKALKLTSIGWSIRSLDTTKKTEEQIFQSIIKKLKTGDIILLHDTSEKTIRILERLLLFLQQNHYTSVPVDQLLEIDAYV